MLFGYPKFCWKNFNMGASDERPKKKIEVGQSGINSEIGSYISFKLFAYLFL